MKNIVDRVQLDGMNPISPADLATCGVSVDHSMPPGIGGVFRDKDGIKFWVVTKDGAGRFVIQAGLVSFTSNRYFTDLESKVVDGLKTVLSELDRSK